MSADQIKCTLLTINEDKLLLPNAAIAEIVSIRNIINVANKPPWMLGYLDWRGNSVPLVSFETLGGVRMPSLASGEVKAAVLYSYSEDKNFLFTSILVQGEPKILDLMPSDIMSVDQEIIHPAIEQRVTVGEEDAGIIDMEKLEQLIKYIMA